VLSACGICETRSRGCRLCCLYAVRETTLANMSSSFVRRQNTRLAVERD